MSGKLKKNLARIIASLAAFAAAMLLPLEGMPRLVLFLAVYAMIGWDVLWRAVRNILRGKVVAEHFLMAVATVGAFFVGDYPEGVVVMLFYQVGEWFQSYAVGRSRRSIAGLMDIRPDYANRRQADGSFARVSPEEVAVDEVILVKPGERAPLDGIVLEGYSTLDTAALTGESLPRDIEPGGELISGCINLTGTLTVRVTKVYGESTVARILDLVENAGNKKATAENFITRFARYYTPVVCIAALLLAVVPPLFTGEAFGPWVYRALTFLVISCPCALVISVPLSFFGGIGGASRLGVLVKGGNYLEVLADVGTVVFDKTGTLTEGRFSVSEISALGMDNDALLELAALAELHSNHPIALSIRQAFAGSLDAERVKAVEEQAGYGVKAEIDGKTVLAGNARMMEANGLAADPAAPAGTVVHLAVDGRYAGWILAEDTVKADAKQAVAGLKAIGVKHTAMLTGDDDAVAARVAQAVGVDKAYARLLPEDKVQRVEELLNNRQGKGKLAFVGDGVNDAPVLARADVGIAMGGLGSDAAIEAADVVIMTDEPGKLPAVMKLARRTMAIVRQNIVFALGIKVVVLLLGALGFATMWWAVFADVGVSVLAILNAMRAMRVKEAAKRPATVQAHAEDDGPELVSCGCGSCEATPHKAG